MRVTGRTAKYIIIIMILIVIIIAAYNLVSALIELQKSRHGKVTIILSAIDYGEIKYVEYVPKPFYEAKSLTCSEIARELLLNAIYGIELDEGKLNFILACERNGYFSRTPSENDFDAESTLYATWLLLEIGAKPYINNTLLIEEIV